MNRWIALIGSTGALLAGHAHAAGPVGCMISPDKVAELGSPVIGVVKTMKVERGDYVKKGDVIAVLQDSIERASLQVANSRFQADAEIRAAEVSLDLTRQRLDRAKNLHGKGFISAQALDQTAVENRVAEEKLWQARQQKNSLEKEMDLARVRLNERTIRSPFDGVIVERYFNPGERVEERPIVRVASVNPLRVEVVMPSSMYGKVKVGESARVIPELPGIAPVNATVSLVDRVLDPASGTYRVRMAMPNDTAEIPAGIRCKAEFAVMQSSPPPAPKALIPDTGGIRKTSGLESPRPEGRFLLRLDYGKL